MDIRVAIIQVDMVIMVMEVEEGKAATALADDAQTTKDTATKPSVSHGNGIGTERICEFTKIMSTFAMT
jgi:hypothetical protein